MHLLDTWEQTAVYRPSDPTQKKIESYAGIPGQYASYYFNRVPNRGVLKGASLGWFSRNPVTWRGLALAGLATWIGLWAARKTGLNVKAKKVLRKIPGVRQLPGLTGRR